MSKSIINQAAVSGLVRRVNTYGRNVIVRLQLGDPAQSVSIAFPNGRTLNGETVTIEGNQPLAVAGVLWEFCYTRPLAKLLAKAGAAQHILPDDSQIQIELRDRCVFAERIVAVADRTQWAEVQGRVSRIWQANRQTHLLVSCWKPDTIQPNEGWHIDEGWKVLQGTAYVHIIIKPDVWHLALTGRQMPTEPAQIPIGTQVQISGLVCALSYSDDLARIVSHVAPARATHLKSGVRLGRSDVAIVAQKIQLLGLLPAMHEIGRRKESQSNLRVA